MNEELLNPESEGEVLDFPREGNYFTELAKVDVSEFVAQKGEYDYLPWAHAIDQLCSRYPDADIQVIRFPLHDLENTLVPYLQTPTGFYVEVAATVNGVRKSEILPVLNYRNDVIREPDASDINTAIKRCAVKAIAMHGLGIYIYAGEDIPTQSDPFTQEQWQTFKELVKGDDPLAFAAMCQEYKRVLDELITAHLEPHEKAKTKTKEK